MQVYKEITSSFCMVSQICKENDKSYYLKSHERQASELFLKNFSLLYVILYLDLKLSLCEIIFISDPLCLKKFVKKYCNISI